MLLGLCVDLESDIQVHGAGGSLTASDPGSGGGSPFRAFSPRLSLPSEALKVKSVFHKDNGGGILESGSTVRK